MTKRKPSSPRERDEFQLEAPEVSHSLTISSTGLVTPKFRWVCRCGQRDGLLRSSALAAENAWREEHMA